MNQRRNFLKLASAAAIPTAAAMVSSGVAHADDGSVKEFLGAWSTLHTLPPGLPGPFHEFLSFEESGAVHETNSFLHNSSNLPGLIPGKVLNASDGFGNWSRLANGLIQVAFRKLLFDAANQNRYFGELHVNGWFLSDGTKLSTPSTHPWHIEVLDPNGALIADFGTATSEGFRIG